MLNNVLTFVLLQYNHTATGPLVYFKLRDFIDMKLKCVQLGLDCAITPIPGGHGPSLILPFIRVKTSTLNFVSYSILGKGL